MTRIRNTKRGHNLLPREVGVSSASGRHYLPHVNHDEGFPSAPALKPTRQEIATLAYFFFEERGRIHGRDVEDWLSAEGHLCTDERHIRKPASNSRIEE